MKTTAKTIGYNNGFRTVGMQAGRNADAFLSAPCNRFGMPPRKRRRPRTAGTTRGQVKTQCGFDERIIARRSSLATGETMKATLGRDKRGFWTAFVYQGGGVRVRHPLPVPFTATREQAQTAFERLLERLERRHGHEHR